jgi:hypothetical protein
MENKYSFVINNSGLDNYTLVMSCFIINEEGQRINVKSETQLNKTLTECLELAQAFIIVE